MSDDVKTKRLEHLQTEMEYLAEHGPSEVYFSDATEGWGFVGCESDQYETKEAAMFAAFLYEYPERAKELTELLEWANGKQVGNARQ